jgi:mercuric ion transport protein
MTESQTGRGALVGGGLAAILASACCLGPLVLVTLGFSGAWIGNLTALEPYRPLFIGVALVAIPEVRSTYKAVFWMVAVLVLIALAYPFVLPLFY